MKKVIAHHATNKSSSMSKEWRACWPISIVMMMSKNTISMAVSVELPPICISQLELQQWLCFMSQSVVFHSSNLEMKGRLETGQQLVGALSSRLTFFSTEDISACFHGVRKQPAVTEELTMFVIHVPIVHSLSKAMSKQNPTHTILVMPF